MQIIFLNT